MTRIFCLYVIRAKTGKFIHISIFLMARDGNKTFLVLIEIPCV